MQSGRLPCNHGLSVKEHDERAGQAGRGGKRTSEEEGVVRISGRVLLRLEQRIEVPEAAHQLVRHLPHQKHHLWE